MEGASSEQNKDSLAGIAGPASALQTPYLVQPADRGFIRLFRITSLYPQPSIVIDVFPLRSEFGACPRFTAISYAWNPNALHPADFRIEKRLESEPVAKQKILVNDIGFLLITDHLLAALCAVKGHHVLAFREPRNDPSGQGYLWIFADAICIDQTDALDKATQVGRMNEIFQTAEKVCVWLGLDVDLDNDVSGIFDGVEYLLSVLRRYKARRDSRNQFPHRVSMSNEKTLGLSELGLPPKHSLFWKTLEALRFNTWFSRLWVVQEVTLAQNVILLWGRSTILWSSYCELTALCEEIINAFFSNGGDENSSGHSSELANTLCYVYNSKVSAFLKLRRNVVALTDIEQSFNNRSIQTGATHKHSKDFQSSAGALHVQVLINIIRSSLVSVPLDRVYAILGLLPSNVRESVQVEYADFFMEYYHIKWAQLFQAIISFTPAAAEFMFSDATYLEGCAGLPSWCPNLEDSGEKRGILGVCPWARAGIDYRTNAGMDGSIIPLSNKLELRVFGSLIGSVVKVIDLSWTKESLGWARMYIDQDNHVDPENAMRLLHTFETCSRFADREQDLASCLIANSYDSRFVLPEVSMEDYTSFKTYLMNQCQHQDDPANAIERQRAMRFGNHFQHLARKRAFFVTENGRYGLTSHKARKGDLLYVLSGFRIPFLLRSQLNEASCELIGEAYAHGLMHGECFENHGNSANMLTALVLS